MTPAPKFKRKNIRLAAGRYRGQNLFFLTLCFEHRHRFGANPRLASWLVGRLQKHADICAFFIHAYCVMPDHMHLLAVGRSDESNLIKFVESFKQDTAMEFARRTYRRLWQFKYYDHILRGSDAADRVAWYIWLNPVRKGLCRSPADYPFLGSFTKLGVRLLNCPVVPQWMPPWKEHKSEICRAKAGLASLKPEARQLNRPSDLNVAPRPSARQCFWTSGMWINRGSAAPTMRARRRGSRRGRLR